MCELDDEIEVLSSIYCGKEEFKLDESSTSSQPRFTMRLVHDDQVIVFTCNVPPTYPSKPPTVSVDQPSLTRKDTVALQRDLLCYLEKSDLVGRSMLCDTVWWLKNNIFNFYEATSSNEASIVSLRSRTVLMQIDHMRSKAKYIRFLQTWCGDLNLVGSLIFFKRFIFIVIQGDDVNTKEFIRKVRTQKVDVDSSGQACKERKLKILGELFEQDSYFHELEIVELESDEEFQLYLTRHHLDAFYSRFIKPNTTQRKTTQ